MPQGKLGLDRPKRELEYCRNLIHADIHHEFVYYTILNQNSNLAGKAVFFYKM